MRTTQCVRAGWLVGVIGACMLSAGTVSAQSAESATERPGSLLIFPKVVCDGTRDTVIQITNTTSMTDQARCFYLDGHKGRSGNPLCTETDFLIALTKQQPTHWNACAGRDFSPSDPAGSNGAGLDPGLVPPVAIGFTGALICAEVDSSLAPVAMNGLKGEASLEGPGLDSSTYNGIAFHGGTGGTPSTSNDKNNVLDLNGGEYSVCPAVSRLNFIANGSTDPVIENLGNGGRCSGGTTPNAPCNNSTECLGQGAQCVGGLSSVLTSLTVLPCNLDLENAVATQVALNFSGSDESEVPFSGSRNVSCWDTFPVDPSLIGTVGTHFATLSMKSGSGGPVIAIAESFHTDSAGNTATAGVNLHIEGICDVGAKANAPCTSDADCPGGVCSGPRFCTGGATPGKACSANVDCGTGTCPPADAKIRLPD